MGLSFSSLVGGITKGAAQAQQGIANRRELEQKALHEALLRRLTEAQIGNYESIAQERARPQPAPYHAPTITEDEGGQYVIGADGKAIPLMAGDRQVGTKPRTATPPRVPMVTDINGNRVEDKPGVRVGAPGGGDKQTSQEQNASAFARTQKELRPQIEALENKGVTPSAGAEFVESLGNVPIVGGMLKPVTTKGSNYLRNEDQQKLRNLAGQWMIATLRLDSQGTITADEFAKYYTEYFAQPGDSPAMVRQKQQARRLKEQEAEGRSGRAGTPSEPPASIRRPDQPNGKTYRPNNPYAKKGPR
jgi:hypothetical protein